MIEWVAFRLWEVAIGAHMLAAAFCVYIHLRIAQRETLSRFGHYALVSSSLLLAEVLAALFCVIFVEDAATELTIRACGRVCAAAGIGIWSGYLTGGFNGVKR